MDKIAMIKEEIYKEAGIFTRPNPWGPITEEEMQEFITLGAMINNGQRLTEEEIERFDTLAMKVPENVLKPETSLGVLGAGFGGAIGSTLPMMSTRKNTKGALIGAGVGALTGAGLGALANRKIKQQVAEQQQKTAHELIKEEIYK